MDRCPAHLTLFFSLVYVKGSRITIITNCRTHNFGFTNPSNHTASLPTGARALGGAADITPRRNQGSMITIITNPCDHAHLAHGMSPVATGSGGPSGLEDSPLQPSRAKTGNARSPHIRSVLAILKLAIPVGNDRCYPGRIQRVIITIITNLN